MDIYDFNRIFFKFACPFLLIATPLFLYGLFNAPNPPEQHVGVGWFIFFSVAGAAVMAASFWYCRTKMGWFGGKK